MQKVSEKAQEARKGAFSVKYMMRGPVLDWGILEAEPGKQMGQHWHEKVEETFYCAQGTGVFICNGKEIPFAAGDAIRCEAGEKHNIKNTGKTSMKVVFIKTPYLPDDKRTD